MPKGSFHNCLGRAINLSCSTNNNNIVIGITAMTVTLVALLSIPTLLAMIIKSLTF